MHKIGVTSELISSRLPKEIARAQSKRRYVTKAHPNYDSTGFSVNIEGEVLATLDNPEAVLRRIQELYDVAEESLIDQLKRHSEDFDRSTTRKPHSHSIAANESVSGAHLQGPSSSNADSSNGDHHRKHSDDRVEQASNKQIQYLLSLGKRRGLGKSQIEEDIAELLGYSTDIYSLSKADACRVLDHYTKQANGRSRAAR